jgi:hypothetical protein
MLIGPIVIWNWGRTHAVNDGEQSPRRRTIKERIVRVLACIAFVYAVGMGLGFYKGYQTQVLFERAMDELGKP